MFMCYCSVRTYTCILMHEQMYCTTLNKINIRPLAGCNHVTYVFILVVTGLFPLIRWYLRKEQIVLTASVLTARFGKVLCVDLSL